MGGVVDEVGVVSCRLEKASCCSGKAAGGRGRQVDQDDEELQRLQGGDPLGRGPDRLGRVRPHELRGRRREARHVEVAGDAVEGLLLDVLARVSADAGVDGGRAHGMDVDEVGHLVEGRHREQPVRELARLVVETGELPLLEAFRENDDVETRRGTSVVDERRGVDDRAVAGHLAGLDQGASAGQRLGPESLGEVREPRAGRDRGDQAVEPEPVSNERVGLSPLERHCGLREERNVAASGTGTRSSRRRWKDSTRPDRTSFSSLVEWPVEERFRGPGPTEGLEHPPVRAQQVEHELGDRRGQFPEGPRAQEGALQAAARRVPDRRRAHDLAQFAQDEVEAGLDPRRRLRHARQPRAAKASRRRRAVDMGPSRSLSRTLGWNGNRSRYFSATRL